MSEICRLSARDMAQRIRAKDLSAREVLDAHLRQIEAVNPLVNAIITLVPEQAYERARQLDEAAARNRFEGPLHGLPVAHKDLTATKGIRTTFGSPIYRDFVPPANDLIVDRIQQAGAVTIGKTNTPEFGAGSQTFNPVFGGNEEPLGSDEEPAGAAAAGQRLLSPPEWFRSPTAAIWAVLCAIRRASVRWLAFGPRPVVCPRSRRLTAGVRCRCWVPWRDRYRTWRCFFRRWQGPIRARRFPSTKRGERFAQPLERDCKGIRIGWCSSFAGLPFDRRVIDVFEAQRSRFESLGCITEDADPDFSGADEAFRVFRALAFCQQFAALKGELKQTIRQEIALGTALTGPQVADAEIKRSRLFARIGQTMVKYDFLVLPVTQVPPFDLNQEYVMEIEGVKMQSYIDWMRSCFFISITGLPAISVPAGFTPEGLPVGIQIVGRHHDDFSVLQIARAFETTQSESMPFAASSLLTGV